MEEDKIDVRVELEGELADKFQHLKDKFGLKNNTEVVRRLIIDAYDLKFVEATKCPT